MSYQAKFVEGLEMRTLLAAVYPSVYEQYMVELHNWARANPSAAATKYNVALNEGPPAIAISADAKQPLAINPYLMDSARSYAQWMLDNDVFDHYGGGTTPQSRMAAAGYNFTGSHGNSENAQLHAGQILVNYTAAMDTDFTGYYRDLTVAGRWHRINIFNPSMKEIGAGIATGNWGQWPGYVTVLNYAYSGTSSFLTGVAYSDTNANDFYTPGEQLSGVTIKAVRNSDGAEFSTTTWASGGYSLALPDGTYTVWGSGGSLGGWVKYDSVTVNGLNVKRDFRPDYVNSQGPNQPQPQPEPEPEPEPEPIPDPTPSSIDFATLNGGNLTVIGTSSSDTIALSVSGDALSVVRNGQTLSFSVSAVTSITINAGAGNDRITLGDGVVGATIYGQDGNDTICAGSGNDLIYGGNGHDSIKAGDGNDTVFAGAGNDIVYGEAGDDVIEAEGGRDRVWAGSGNDMIYGGTHDDTLFGDDGNDSIWGQNQDDLMDGGAGADFLTGGRGIDTIDYSRRTANLYVEISRDYASPTGRSGESGEYDNVLNDIENILGGSGNDRLIGSSFPNVIRGGDGDDTIYGMGAADSLYGDAGNDRFFAAHGSRDYIHGGAGNDILSSDEDETIVSIERIMR